LPFISTPLIVFPFYSLNDIIKEEKDRILQYFEIFINILHDEIKNAALSS